MCCIVQKLSGIFSACDAESHIPPINTPVVPKTAKTEIMNNSSFRRDRNDFDTICGIAILTFEMILLYRILLWNF